MIIFIQNSSCSYAKEVRNPCKLIQAREFPLREISFDLLCILDVHVLIGTRISRVETMISLEVIQSLEAEDGLPDEVENRHGDDQINIVSPAEAKCINVYLP